MLREERSKKVCYLLALILGGVGAHLFYAKKYKRGILYLLFCWTHIPIFLGWIDIFFIHKWFKDEKYSEDDKSEARRTILGKKENIENNVAIKHKKLSSSNLFYPVEDIILPKYAHLKTPMHILDFLDEIKNPNKNRKITRNFTIEMSFSTRDITFAKDSLKYRNRREALCEFKPLFKYWTTFEDLDNKQKKWYFFWRARALNGEYLNTDLSYIILFVYELLNYTFNEQAAFNVSMLEILYENYKEVHNKLKNYIPSWISDFLYELGEKELAEQWTSTEVNKTSKLYEKIAKEDIEKISFTLWKPFIQNYRETEFFKKHKNKIYSTFKKSIALLKENYKLEGKNLLEQWYDEKEIIENKYLFEAAVIVRNVKQVEIKTTTNVEARRMYDEITALFGLSENVVRNINGEKRKIKVDENILPENFKGLLIDIMEGNKNSKEIKKRFKLVQKSEENRELISIPKPEKEDKYESKFNFDISKINMLKVQSEVLQNVFIEKGYEEDDENIFYTAAMEKETNVLEDEVTDKTVTQGFPLITISDDEDWEEFTKTLTNSEAQFLSSFQSLRKSAADSNNYFKQQGMMAGTFVSNINEKANRYLDDNIIELNNEYYEIYEEFEELINTIKEGVK